MELKDLGYNEKTEKSRIQQNLTDYEAGRVIAEHRERYIVRTAQGETEAEITGNLRYSAKSREDFPAVGDWVALIMYDNNTALIHQIIPRTSAITRKAAGHTGEVQIIAANVDTALLIQAVDRDFNINRLERYLTLCYAARVSPVIVLTKTDLITEERISAITTAIRQRIPDVPVIAVSSITGNGYDALNSIMEKGKTYCMLGSSGAGKSTLLNFLSGREVMHTGDISQSTGKGRHTTSHRELLVLDNGSILIDNPGMREVGIADTALGLETTFDTLLSLAQHCRFKNCTHTNEDGCAVLEAVANGTLDESLLENYLKLEREKAWFETSQAEKKRKEKIFGKILKDYQKKDIKGKKI